MELTDAIAQIQGAPDIEGLKAGMQKIVEKYGFSAWCMVDAGRAYQEVPFFFGTSSDDWHEHYRKNGFLQIDPYIAKARRTNTPFDWASISLPPAKRGPKSKVFQLMDAARDNGFREGLIFPCHFNDQMGRRHSAVCVFYWTEDVDEFKIVVEEVKIYLHIIAIYFITRAMEIAALTRRDGKPLWSKQRIDDRNSLTDRERDVISWAARGKTAQETGDILQISTMTVEKHLANVIRKVDAKNRTHAVAKCIHLSLIDI